MPKNYHFGGKRGENSGSDWSYAVQKWLVPGRLLWLIFITSTGHNLCLTEHSAKILRTNKQDIISVGSNIVDASRRYILYTFVLIFWSTYLRSLLIFALIFWSEVLSQPCRALKMLWNEWSQVSVAQVEAELLRFKVRRVKFYLSQEENEETSNLAKTGTIWSI